MASVGPLGDVTSSIVSDNALAAAGQHGRKVAKKSNKLEKRDSKRISKSKAKKKRKKTSHRFSKRKDVGKQK